MYVDYTTRQKQGLLTREMTFSKDKKCAKCQVLPPAALLDHTTIFSHRFFCAIKSSMFELAHVLFFISQLWLCVLLMRRGPTPHHSVVIFLSVRRIACVKSRRISTRNFPHPQNGHSRASIELQIW